MYFLIFILVHGSQVFSNQVTHTPENAYKYIGIGIGISVGIEF